MRGRKAEIGSPLHSGWCGGGLGNGSIPILQGLCGHASGSSADKNGDKKREPQAPSLNLSAPVF